MIGIRRVTIQRIYLTQSHGVHGDFILSEILVHTEAQSTRRLYSHGVFFHTEARRAQSGNSLSQGMMSFC